ncbi:hypothetical protein [Chitinilyticum piscinae]|uniref:Uncharacterized protein n=1 Tax=Chitinilyticum piscinae TaxID=2866724 RepID=A0A8J7KBU0_9NEIS|nr:hypothetical protein [Chitinilyticum piscinae]MBE9610579.1 hypothetical protein [Chitinilyticum piscinae]
MKHPTILSALTLALLLAACGDNTATAPQASAVTTTSTATVPAANPPQAGWSRYQNAQSQLQVDYPGELVAEAGSASGNRFKSADGSVIMSIEAIPGEGKSLGDFAKLRQAAQVKSKASVKESHEGGSWYMLVSGKGKDIVYEHGFLRDGVFSVLNVTYPAEATATWQPKIADILKTIVPGTAAH